MHSKYDLFYGGVVLIGLVIGAFGNLGLMVAILAIIMGIFFVLESFPERPNHGIEIISAGFILGMLISLVYLSIIPILGLAFCLTNFFLATH